MKLKKLIHDYVHEQQKDAIYEEGHCCIQYGGQELREGRVWPLRHKREGYPPRHPHGGPVYFIVINNVNLKIEANTTLGKVLFQYLNRTKNWDLEEEIDDGWFDRFAYGGVIKEAEGEANKKRLKQLKEESCGLETNNRMKDRIEVGAATSEEMILYNKKYCDRQECACERIHI